MSLSLNKLQYTKDKSLLRCFSGEKRPQWSHMCLQKRSLVPRLVKNLNMIFSWNVYLDSFYIFIYWQLIESVLGETSEIKWDLTEEDSFNSPQFLMRNLFGDSFNSTTVFISSYISSNHQLTPWMFPWTHYIWYTLSLI